MPEAFSTGFILILLGVIALRLWLSLRQESHVRAHRATVPAAFAERISLAAHQKAADYTIARTRLSRVGLALETLVLLILTYGGGLNALHEFWSAHFEGLAYGIALIASVVVLASLADIPLDLYRQFRLETRFGFNRMTPRLYLSDRVKQTLLSALLGLPLLAAVLWLMEIMGSGWWLYVGLLWIGFNLLILFAYPLWIAPLFNRFSPLADGELKARIDALLERCHFGAREIFVMDGSRRSSHGNAYFTGFGKARRIVFFDTLLERLSLPQVEAVLAHELGHFHHKHIIKRTTLIFSLALLLLALLDQLIDAPWFYQSLGVATGNTSMGLLLSGLVLPVIGFPLTPFMSFLSRRHEFQADAYAARMASAADLSDALVKLYEDNAATLTPDPIHSLFYDSHPPASQRIARLRWLAAGNARINTGGFPDEETHGGASREQQHDPFRK